MASTLPTEILRGEVWDFDPDPVKGREQGKKVRPALVISSNQFNESRADLVIVMPLTTRNRGIPCHVKITPKDGGVRKISFAMCEQIRSISKERLKRRRGMVRNQQVLQAVSEWVCDLLDLEKFY